MQIKNILLLLKLLNIFLNYIFSINLNFLKLDFMDYFTTIKDIEVEDISRDKTQLKKWLMFVGSVIFSISIAILLMKTGDDGSTTSTALTIIKSSSADDVD